MAVLKVNVFSSDVYIIAMLIVLIVHISAVHI